MVLPMTTPKTPGSVDLRTIFLSLQKQMAAELKTTRDSFLHDVTVGAATELSWIKLFDAYLPKRYQVDKAFVLDSRGQCSEEIDIVIFDRHYSPFLLKQNGARYIPAESVYAVIEVRQVMKRYIIKYAGAKAASVRRLHRTTAPIPHAGGTYPPQKPFPILAGVVTLESIWQHNYIGHVRTAIADLLPQERIDLGCALHGGAFHVQYPPFTKQQISFPPSPRTGPETGRGSYIRQAKRVSRGPTPRIETSGPDDALICFFLALLSRLQSLGTVPALDFSRYAKALHPR